jgi:hypothetical protein
MENDEITYVLKWIDKIDGKSIEDFLFVENAVFGGFTRELFERKYIKNIYGPSLIIIAYLNGKPVAADAMIRNDINGVAYQSADTCVLEDCRGKGVFSQMKKREIEAIGDNYAFYGFPNGNSFSGFIKMGWDVQCRLYPTVFIFPFLYDLENQKLIDYEYAKWLSESCKKYYYFKCGRKYYLIKHGQKHYQMIGRIVPNAALLFERKKHPGIIKCYSQRKSFFNKSKYQGSIITYGQIPFDIPYWKCDTFLG